MIGLAEYQANPEAFSAITAKSIGDEARSRASILPAVDHPSANCLSELPNSIRETAKTKV
jgi:hypothetical protein